MILFDNVEYDNFFNPLCCKNKCFLYQVNTKHIKSKRLVLHTLNTDYEYIDCVKRGRNPKYETKTIHGYAEAFINLIEAPIVVNGKVI